MMPGQRLQGKVAVITGGSSGIGLATARRFVREGAYVFITGRRQAELDRAASLIGERVTAVQGDVADLDHLDRLYATVAREKGGIDIVFANAGIVEVVTLPNIRPDQFDRIFDINVRGMLFTVQKALPLLRDGGAIVLNCSIGANKARTEGYSIYNASKAAIRSFARTWTVDLKKRRIRVNALSPGPIDTPLMDDQAADREGAARLRALHAAAIPLGRMGDQDEVAAAALFLASDEASFITGIDLCVDGGVAQI